jgi:hypothetical protein
MKKYSDRRGRCAERLESSKTLDKISYFSSATAGRVCGDYYRRSRDDERKESKQDGHLDVGPVSRLHENFADIS